MNFVIGLFILLLVVIGTIFLLNTFSGSEISNSLSDGTSSDGYGISGSGSDWGTSSSSWGS